jgi:hypothetical protein
MRKLMFVKSLVMGALVVASCSSLAGNHWDQFDPYYEWEKKPSHPPITDIRYTVDPVIWNIMCEKPSDACAFRDKDKCWIISPKPVTNAYLDWHERKHCAGYDHKPLEWAVK